jgi:hypothetical protein
VEQLSPENPDPKFVGPYTDLLLHDVGLILGQMISLYYPSPGWFFNSYI